MNANIYNCCSLNKPLRKNMQKSIPMILAFLALLALTLCCACSSEKPVDAGLSQITTPEISAYISFEEASQKFEEYKGTDKLPVYYLFSRDVDSSGNATTWLFGVHPTTGTELLMYDRTGWKTIPWNATLPSEEIILNRVLSPGALFIQNKEYLSNVSTSERRDLVLKQGLYTLTISSGNASRTLRFNATTGELITNNVR